MRRFVVAALLAPILTACGGSEPSGPAVVATVTLSPTALSLASLGQTQQVTSTVKNQSGAAIANAAATWSSSNTGVASVSAGGMVTATGNGPAQSRLPPPPLFRRMSPWMSTKRWRPFPSNHPWFS